MKALTILQPWASLIAYGEKTIETRGWSTRYRGELAIHASKTRVRIHPELWDLSRYGHALRRHDVWAYDDLPFGAVVAVAQLVDCVDVTVHPLGLDQQEATFGDYSHGRFAWILRDVVAITPIETSGRQGFWQVALPAKYDLTTAK